MIDPHDFQEDAYPVALDAISKALRFALSSPSIGRGQETLVLQSIRDQIHTLLEDTDPPSAFLFAKARLPSTHISPNPEDGNQNAFVQDWLTAWSERYDLPNLDMVIEAIQETYQP